MGVSRKQSTPSFPKNYNGALLMLFLFYTNTIFSKFMELNMSTSLFKKRISFSNLEQTIMFSLQFLKEKTCVRGVMIISELAKHFFFFIVGNVTNQQAAIMLMHQLDFMYSQDGTLSDASSVNPKYFGGKPFNRHHKRNYVRFHLWVYMKHCQVPVYLKVISNSLFNISLWIFPLYILAQ